MGKNVPPWLRLSLSVRSSRGGTKNFDILDLWQIIQTRAEFASKFQMRNKKPKSRAVSVKCCEKRICKRKNKNIFGLKQKILE